MKFLTGRGAHHTPSAHYSLPPLPLHHGYATPLRPLPSQTGPGSVLIRDSPPCSCLMTAQGTQAAALQALCPSPKGHEVCNTGGHDSWHPRRPHQCSRMMNLRRRRAPPSYPTWSSTWICAARPPVQRRPQGAHHQRSALAYLPLTTSGRPHSAGKCCLKPPSPSHETMSRH